MHPGAHDTRGMLTRRRPRSAAQRAWLHGAAWRCVQRGTTRSPWRAPRRARRERELVGWQRLDGRREQGGSRCLWRLRCFRQRFAWRGPRHHSQGLRRGLPQALLDPVIEVNRRCAYGIVKKHTVSMVTGTCSLQ